jgi:hypothetical protein
LHEQVGGGPAIENKMDMHNNAVGRALATEMKWQPNGYTHRYDSGAMRQSLQTAVTNSLNNGQLWYIKNGQMVTN